MSVSTETYHAMYRVLEAFSLFNTILGMSSFKDSNRTRMTRSTPAVWGFLFFLLALVLRQHFMGHRSMWYNPVTSYSWLGKSKGSKSKLPQPVTSRSRSRGRSYAVKGKGDRYSAWAPRSHKTPVRAHLATDKYDKYKRGASPRR